MDSESQNPFSAGSNRSKSDAGFCGSFLNRVEITQDKNTGRRSDIVHYRQKNGIVKMRSWDSNSVKLGQTSNSKISIDTFSNKESSNNNECSTLSYEISNSNRTSEPKHKSIMMQKHTYDLGETTPTLIEDAFNPFSVPVDVYITLFILINKSIMLFYKYY